MDWKALFLDPNGRIGTRDFWIGWGVLFGASVVLGVAGLGLLTLALLVPWACVQAKRLHDLGCSAWWMALPLGAHLAAMGVAYLAGGTLVVNWAGANVTSAALADPVPIGGGALVLVAALGSMATAIGFLIWVGTQASTLEANRFGPPPAQPVTAS